MKLNLTFARRLVLLFLLLIMGLCLASGAAYVIGRLNIDSVAATRIAVVAQCLLAFILPALIFAMIITRLPADFLLLRHWPEGRKLLLALGGLCVMFPVVEAVNYLCRLIPWSDSVLQLEARADSAIALIAGAHTIPNLLITILIVGVLTGFAEEIFFRGALQQTLLTRPLNRHMAVWLAAIIFSLMHVQPVGFIPRAMLGAYFGYVALWSRSLYAAAICHAVNNSVALLLLFLR